MGKQSRSDKKDIAFLDSLANKNKAAITTPPSHLLFIMGVGCVTTGLPIGLFFTQYYHADSLLEAAPHFTVGILVSAFVLALAINRWAVCVRQQLHTEREAVVSTKREATKEALKQSAFVESTAIAMSSLNLCYFLGYLLWATYLLPSYGLTDKFNYLFSTVGASATAFGFGSLYHSIKL